MTDSDYQKYLIAAGSHPEAIILMRQQSNGKFSTFGDDAVLVGSILGRSILRVNRHRMITVSRNELAALADKHTLEFIGD
jgi:hypothetical protein